MRTVIAFLLLCTCVFAAGGVKQLQEATVKDPNDPGFVPVTIGPAKIPDTNGGNTGLIITFPDGTSVGGTGIFANDPTDPNDEDVWVGIIINMPPGTIIVGPIQVDIIQGGGISRPDCVIDEDDDGHLIIDVDHSLGQPNQTQTPDYSSVSGGVVGGNP